MLWPASIDSQRPAPRREAATTCAGRSSSLTHTINHKHQRWRG